MDAQKKCQLNVKSFPCELLYWLKQQAQDNNRSLNKEVINLLSMLKNLNEAKLNTYDKR